MTKEKEREILNNMDMSDVVTLMMTNDVACYSYARKEITSLKRKYRFLSLAMIIYILYTEGVFKEIKKIINNDVLNK